MFCFTFVSDHKAPFSLSRFKVRVNPGLMNRDHRNRVTTVAAPWTTLEIRDEPC